MECQNEKVEKLKKEKVFYIVFANVYQIYETLGKHGVYFFTKKQNLFSRIADII